MKAENDEVNIIHHHEMAGIANLHEITHRIHLNEASETRMNHTLAREFTKVAGK